MMQNDAPAPAPLAVVPVIESHTTETFPVGSTAGDEFHRMMHQLEELKEKPLFSEDELEEATEDDDLFDDEDYNLQEVIRRHKERLEEIRRKAGIVDDADDDYYDDYSAEEDEEEQRRKQTKLSPSGTAPDEGTDNVMQDYLSNIKSKSAPHRFKSKLDDFNDSGDGDLLSGIGSNRKLRKNDSIKIISTPNGKVGIVYKVEPKVTEDESTRKATPDGNSGNGAVSNGGGAVEQRQNKITPVITADGKVALLYRGASDNGDTFRNKYEPITAKDILQLIDNNNNNNNNNSNGSAAGGNSPASGAGSSNTNSSIKHITNNNIYNSHNNYGNSYDSFNRNVNNVIVDSHPPDTGDDSRENNAALGGGASRIEQVPTVAYPRITTPMPRNSPSNVHHHVALSSTTSSHVPATPTSSSAFGKLDGTLMSTGSGPFQPYDRQENSLLINRPLSEVLGIRKNQYLETNTIKIPNSETSTNKMRIGTNNNLLSSLLHNLQHGVPNGTSVGDHREPHLRRPAAEDEQHRRAGYSVNGFSRSRFYINRRTTPALPPRVIKEESEEDTFIGDGDDNALPEVINLAIIPAFEHEIDEKYIRPHHGDLHRRHRHQYNVAPGQPAVHCAMQALVACAVLATFFGIVGTYFKSRVVDHIRVLYW
ncbi:homeobox protein 2-like [Anopheles moucheti]|uniref:homeobox protein 2-like n=1 Tax=Anopheles moucheti TaxID=186751 RepID=UPI0022F03B6F|nr:homeobox protein 2-like [Anopheles moucheti]